MPLWSGPVPSTSGLQMLWFQKQFEQQKVPLLLLQTSLANVSPKVHGKGSHALMCVYAHRFMHMYAYVCMLICMYVHAYTCADKYVYECIVWKTRCMVVTHSETPVCRQPGGISAAPRDGLFLKGWLHDCPARVRWACDICGPCV